MVGINWKEESQADITEPFLPLSQESGYNYGHEKAVYLMAFSQLIPVVQLLKYPGKQGLLELRSIVISKFSATQKLLGLR